MISLTDLLAEYDAASAHSVALVDGLDHADVAWRPNEHSSAMAWHLGHQGVVAHFMLRNLTAAEVSVNPDFDAIFDSATPEPARGSLPPVDQILDYRRTISKSIHRVVTMIDGGEVGAPAQLRLVATGLLQAVINHEYQHAKWVEEVRSTFTTAPPPQPMSTRLVDVEGYWMIAAG